MLESFMPRQVGLISVLSGLFSFKILTEWVRSMSWPLAMPGKLYDSRVLKNSFRWLFLEV